MNGTSGDPHRYDDIIDLPHPTSKGHARMPLGNRAAQFSPFAALVGYGAAIRETARLTDARIELGEDEQLAISRKLQWIADHIEARPAVTLTFYQPDDRKAGGAYVEAMGRVKRVDDVERTLVLTDGKRIPIDALIAVDGDAPA